MSTNKKNKLPKIYALIGFASAPSQATAASNTILIGDILLKLYALPSWLLAAIAAGICAGLFFLCWIAYRRWYQSKQVRIDPEHKTRMGFFVVLTGAAAGFIFTWLINDSWEIYLAKVITNMPPTSKGKKPGFISPQDLTPELLAKFLDKNPAGAFRLTVPEQARAALPDAVKNLLADAQEREGTLEVQHIDYEDQRQSHEVYLLETDAGEHLSLHFAAHPTGALTGSRLKVRGTLFNGIQTRDAGNADGALLLENGDTDLQILELSPTSSASGATATATDAPPLANSLGEQKTIIMLVNFQDNPSNQPWSIDQARTSALSAVNQFIAENSYGQTWLSGDVAGWFTLPLDSTLCDSANIANKANLAAAAAGYDLTKYAHHVYIFPANSVCGWVGTATIGGNPSKSWINGSIDLKIVGHEFGHNLGLQTSHLLECGSTTVGSNCVTSKYGDHFDIMGNYKAGHMNVFQKIQLGWLDYGSSPSVSEIHSSGTYLLEPYELASTTNGIKALKILRQIDPTTGAKSWYFLEFRQAKGMDGFLAKNTDATNGVLFHIGSDGDSNSSHLIDMTPASQSNKYKDWEDSALAQAVAYTDPDTGTLITIQWVDNTGASVDVKYGTPPCARANPTLAITPQKQSGVAGAALSYSLTLTNNDDPACAPTSTYYLQAKLPSGWNANFTDDALTSPPGSKVSTTLALTSPTTSASGNYSAEVTANSSYAGYDDLCLSKCDSGFFGTASNSSQSSYSNTVYADYGIITSLSDTLATDKSSYNRTQTVTAKSIVTAGGTPISGASVIFTIIKSNGSMVTQNVSTDATGTASISFKLDKKDPTGSYSIKSQATLQNQLDSAQTTFMVN